MPQTTVKPTIQALLGVALPGVMALCLMTLCLITSPAHMAHADGGRDPGDTGITRTPPPSQPPAEPQPQVVAPAPAPAPPPRAVAVPTPPVAPAPRRATRPRIVEVAPSGLPPEGEARLIENEVIVRFRLSSTPGSRDRAIRGLGMTHLAARTFTLAGVTVHRYRLRPGADLRETIAALESRAAVVTAQPNYLYALQQDASTGKLPQYGNDRIALEGAHARTRGAGARIAVIDTAIDATHPEFASARLSTFDVTGTSSAPDPHGTSVAGILAADARLTGVSPEAEILGIAAFAPDDSGTTRGNTWWISEALNIAFDRKADILNLSFAGPADPLLERAMEGAVRQGMIAVAAAGNEGPEAATLFPAGYASVISVTATDAEDQIYPQANTGAHLDMAAPGVDLLVLGKAPGYRTSSGTSMAAAYVSGIAALVVSANPGADDATVRALLEQSATDLGAPGRDSVFGAGLPSAAAATGGLTN